MPATNTATLDSRFRSLFRVGGISAWIQLVCILISLSVAFTLGGEPATAEEYFTALGDNRLAELLRADFLSMVLVALTVFPAFALYAAARREHPLYPALATGLIFIGITISMATHGALSMVYLSDRFAQAGTEAERTLLLSAGEAVLATHWWHSTGGLMAGLFMQGGMVLLLFFALRSKYFHPWMAYTGIIANGLDFLHILVGLVLPGVGAALLYIGGVFYLLWFPLLGWDLLRLKDFTETPAHQIA